MEQAVNLFNKGLLSDTHPMVLGNDTLSDALNATFVTMNGNEVVLLNDMGNRRVDNAFLPSGFEPVGMKEYGGIIYVASYNPITNRSLIGSFPSPERKINSLDDKSLGTLFENFFSGFLPNEEGINEKRFIISDTTMFPLTGDTSLHAGDKFIIYSNSDIKNEWKNYVSNCYNTLGNIIISPKNKHITLYAGVLNSQNQFVDITKTLKRWKNGEIMKYDDSYSDEYIFNDGYFINSSLFEGDSSSYTIDDRQLIKERQTKPANTYAYKLTGPLYLKVQLNHIQEFSFDITGDKDKRNNRLNLEITANIIYNCPDDVKAFDFYIEKDGIYSKVSNIEYHSSDPIYINDLYKRTVTANVAIKCPNDFNYDGILKYFIGVDSGIPLEYIPDNKSYYIETLSQYGELDLSKLNSGYVGLKAFRFFNSNNSTTVTYVMETYPKKGLTFTNFRIGLLDVENESNEIIIPISDTLLNGKGIASFNWDNIIEERKLYKVYFYYDDNLNGSDIEIKKDFFDNTINDPETRWLLTTELFNDCYNPKSSNFVEDYLEKISSSGKYYNEILYNKLKLNFEIINNSQILNSKYKTTETKGKLITKKNIGILEYSTIESYIIKQLLSDYVDILNKELYPVISLTNNKLEISNDVIVDDSEIEKEYVLNGKIYKLDENTNSDIKLKFNNLITSKIESNENILTITVNYENRLISEDNGSSDRSVSDGFYKLNSEKFRTNVLKNSISNTGFFIANKDLWGDDDHHWYGIVFDSKKCSLPLRINTDFDNYSRRYFDDKNSDDEIHLDFNDLRVKELYSIMNDIPNKYTFAFIFSAINMVGEGQPLAYVSNISQDGWVSVADEKYANEGYCPITSCKVWWRNGIADEWVLLNSETGMFGGDSSISYKFPRAVLSNGEEKYIFIGLKDKETWSDENYLNLKKYDELYNKEGSITVNETYTIEGNIRNKVLSQIANFLDPNNEVVYDMYKTTSLYEHNLRTIDKNNYLYNKPYSGNVIISIGYSIPKVIINDVLALDNKIHMIIDNNILRILPFYVDDILEEQYRQISIPIKSNEEFEDDINNIITNEVISNIYLDNGTFRDINYKQLSGDTIYKIIEEDDEFKGLKPLTNPPYKVYKDTGLDFNSLVSTSNYTGSSVASSLYLRAMGDEDSKMSLRFAGGNLRTVEYTKFQNLS